MCFKGDSPTKLKIVVIYSCHSKPYFLLLNTNILKNVNNKTFGSRFDFHCIFFVHSMGTKTGLLPVFFKIYSRVQQKKKKVVQVWNYVGV